MFLIIRLNPSPSIPNCSLIIILQGFVSEPDSSSVVSFRTGVKDVDPSQDPFGAPPEVGLPDLSVSFTQIFGSKQ